MTRKEFDTDSPEEARMVDLLRKAGPPAVPSDLEARLIAAVRVEFGGDGAGDAAVTPIRRRRMPPWQLAAAAGLVLAVATPVLMDRMQERPGPVVDDPTVEVAVVDRLPSPWLDDDAAVVGGEPVLDDLTDDDLRLLLEEMGG